MFKLRIGVRRNEDVSRWVATELREAFKSGVNEGWVE